MEAFWLNDISVLFDKNKLNKFIPIKSYDNNEKLNSLVRAGSYISILLIIITGNLNYLFILIFSVILTYIIFINENDSKDKKLDEKIENYKNIKNDKDIKKREIIPSDYLNKCVLPTDDNPFMNVLVTDSRERRKACKTYNDKKIAQLVEDKFSKGLFKDINGIYNNENSQREFYTTPNTMIPNDQEGFSKWCYLTPKTCKEGNGNQCVGNNPEKLNGQSYQFI